MIFALIILVPILVFSVWAFLRFSPKVESRQRILLFNLSVLGVGLLLCAFLTLKVYGNLAAGPDRAWWPVLSVLGAMVVFPVVLLVGGVVRKSILFKSPNNRV